MITHYLFVRYLLFTGIVFSRSKPTRRLGIRRFSPVPITFCNFPCDDFPDGKDQRTISIPNDAALVKLLSDIDAVAVSESPDGSGSLIVPTSLNAFKHGVPYFLIFKRRFDTANGRLENGVKNAATAFEHKANRALVDELTRGGRLGVELALEGFILMRPKTVPYAEIDGLVFAHATAPAPAGDAGDAYLLESKMYAKVEDLAVVEEKILALTNPPVDAVTPITLGGRKLTGVLATIDTTPDVIAAAKAAGVWVLVQDGSGFNLITHS